MIVRDMTVRTRIKMLYELLALRGLIVSSVDIRLLLSIYYAKNIRRLFNRVELQCVIDRIDQTTVFHFH